MTNYVKIFDTTLRDGEQSPGATMTSAEKLEVARSLARLGVDVIEAGFPAASPDDLEAVRRIAVEVGTPPAGEPDAKVPTIAGLARANKSDIDKAWEAVKDAAKPRIHTFLATSPIHMKHKLKMDPEEVIQRVSEMVAYAKSLCADVEFSPEDAGRSDPEFLYVVLGEAIKSGATTLNIPDTVGYTTPDEFYALIKGIIEKTPGMHEGITVSVHCHDDLGLATANTLAGIRAGARQAEVTINGIGERAGNTSLEEVVMALKTRHPVFELETGIETTQIARVSKQVSNYTGMVVQPNKAIVGANAFAHEAGIHQDGMLKHRETYEIMRPEDVGVVTGTDLVLGKHSGRAGFSAHLKRMGIQVSAEQLQGVYDAFIALADKKKVVYDDDIVELLREFISDVPRVYAIKCLQVSAGNRSIPTATVQIEKDGQVVQDSATGSGPVEAALKAIDRLTGVKGELKSFAMQAVTHGEDALGEASVQVKYGDDLVAAKGSDIDIVMASAKAYVNALNRHLFIEKGAGKI